MKIWKKNFVVKIFRKLQQDMVTDTSIILDFLQLLITTETAFPPKSIKYDPVT